LKLYLYGYLQQRGSDVVAGPSGSRLQEHRRIPAHAP
jgi:hypothetical protein